MCGSSLPVGHYIARDTAAAGAGTARVRRTQVFARKIQAPPTALLFIDRCCHLSDVAHRHIDQVIAAQDHDILDHVEFNRVKRFQ